MSLEHSIELLTSGIMFDFDAPTPAMIEAGDLGRALSNTCRFGGHVARYYSVAEHAVLVSRLVEDSFGPELGFAALHHDSHEAYLGDVPSPLKRKYGEAWKEQFAWPIDKAICTKLGIRQADLHHDAVVAADALALAWEAAKLKPSGRASLGHGAWTDVPRGEVPDWAVQCWQPKLAEVRFLDAHYRLLRELVVP